jgi:hypothetical protein
MTSSRHGSFNTNAADNGAPSLSPAAVTPEFAPMSGGDIAFGILREAREAASVPSEPHASAVSSTGLAYTDDTAFNDFDTNVAGGHVLTLSYNGGGIYGDYLNYSTYKLTGLVFNNGSATSFTYQDATTVIRAGSNSGQYQVGYALEGNATPCFLIDNGTVSALNPTDLADFTVVGVNSSGVIAGGFYNNGGDQGFTYVNGTYTYINDPDGSNTQVAGITDTGIVFGTYDNSDGVETGFMSDGSSFTDIAAPGAEFTDVFGMNDEGQAIGVYADSDGNQHSFVESGGSFITLDDPNATGATDVVGIDDSGTVFGYYFEDNTQVFFTTDDTLCFLRGTRILTPSGEIPIEALRIGDRVATRGGGFQRVKWIGQQNYDPRFLARNPAKLPVRIAASALGDGVPARDLFVSPGHSILLDGTLVLASALVNGITVTQTCAADLRGRVEYFNIDLNSHDCLLAEGAWAESFADGPGLRDQFHNAAGFYALYPDYAAPEEIRLCAPRPERGPALAAALRPVVARAGAGLRVGRLEGVIDVMTASRLEGWAIDTEHPELPVLLDIVLDGAVIATALACDFRADLLQARKGRGRCAFFVTLPAPLPAGRLHTLRIRRAADGVELAVSEGLRAAA